MKERKKEDVDFSGTIETEIDIMKMYSVTVF